MSCPKASAFLAVVALASLGWSRESSAQTWTNLSAECGPLGGSNFTTGSSAAGGYFAAASASPAEDLYENIGFCQWKPAYQVNSPVSNVTGLTVDANGAPWWIDGLTHHIHTIQPATSTTPATDTDIDALGSDSHVWMSVGVGQIQNQNNQVWAIDTNQNIWVWYGWYSTTGYPNPGWVKGMFGLEYLWVQVPGQATQIAMFSEKEGAAQGCGADFYTPWVITRYEQIYRYDWSNGGATCLGSGAGAFSRIAGQASIITSGDYVLGSDGNPYIWNGSQFVQRAAPPVVRGCTVKTLGGTIGGATLMATDSCDNLYQFR